MCAAQCLHIYGHSAHSIGSQFVEVHIQKRCQKKTFSYIHVGCMGYIYMVDGI
jgi:hypothetical protein